MPSAVLYLPAFGYINSHSWVWAWPNLSVPVPSRRVLHSYSVFLLLLGTLLGRTSSFRLPGRPGHEVFQASQICVTSGYAQKQPLC